MIDTDQIGALGLDVQWQEPWDPNHGITTHPKSVPMLPHLHTSASKPLYCVSICTIVCVKPVSMLVMSPAVTMHSLAKACCNALLG